MRQLCIALAVAAGCGFEHGRVNNRQDASSIDVAVADASIDARVDARPDASNVITDAMVDAPIAIDTDMDTILDTVDNCPKIANTNQRNHDGDPKGDVCDLCPHLPSSTDPDGDTDGVGDACDPRPSTGGDALVLFEGFYEASAITGWAATGPGTWAVGNGWLTQSSTQTGGSTIGPTTVIARAAVTSRLRVESFGTGFGFDTPAISIAAAVASGQIYYCSVSQANGDSIYSTADWNGGFAIDDVSWAGTFAAMSEIQLTELVRGTTESCTAVQGATTATVPPLGVGPVSGAVRLSTTSASSSFDYLFVVAIGA